MFTIERFLVPLDDAWKAAFYSPGPSKLNLNTHAPLIDVRCGAMWLCHRQD